MVWMDIGREKDSLRVTRGGERVWLGGGGSDIARWLSLRLRWRQLIECAGFRLFVKVVCRSEGCSRPYSPTFPLFILFLLFLLLLPLLHLLLLCVSMYLCVCGCVGSLYVASSRLSTSSLFPRSYFCSPSFRRLIFCFLHLSSSTFTSFHSSSAVILICIILFLLVSSFLVTYSSGGKGFISSFAWFIFSASSLREVLLFLLCDISSSFPVYSVSMLSSTVVDLSKSWRKPK